MQGGIGDGRESPASSSCVLTEGRMSVRKWLLQKSLVSTAVKMSETTSSGQPTAFALRECAKAGRLGVIAPCNSLAVGVDPDLKLVDGSQI
jgi:hypothetical protein